MGGNPRIDEMGISQAGGAMEGKEVRIGAASGALWSVTTTVTSNGSVNSMHDSTMPLSGMIEMLNMQINTFFPKNSGVRPTINPLINTAIIIKV